MSRPEDFGAFFTENKETVKDYVETRMEVYRLQVIKVFSKSAGLLLWSIISIFLVFLVIIFAGIVVGFWFSSLFNSNVLGFGLTTLIMVAVIALLTVFRRQLFINPIIRDVISHTQNNEEQKEYETKL